MKTITKSYTIHAPLQAVWQALTEPKAIIGWGGGPVKMSEKVNAKFSLWGGSIWGTNKKVIPLKELVQEWYSESNNSEWEKPSVVTFQLTEKDNAVFLKLYQTDIPDADMNDIDQGWDDYYLGPLKEYVEKKKK